MSAQPLPKLDQGAALSSAGWQFLSDEEMEIFLKALDATPMLTPESKLPTTRTVGFQSFQHPEWPVLPGDVPGVPFWEISDGVYLLNDLTVNYSVFKGTSGGMSLLDSGPPTPPGGGTNSGGGGLIWSSYTPPTNGWLYLTIEGVSNGMAAVTLMETTNEIYELMSVVDLHETNTWQTEQSLHGTASSNTIPTLVPVLGRTNHLFFWARVWTTNDVDADSLPDWWEWENFGDLSQGGTDDYNGDTVNNATEYANGTDPNKIAFKIEATNNYVGSSSASLQLNVSGGVPSSMAVLVDNTNLPGATWTTYDANPSVYLGVTEGWHEIWVGLRGRKTTSQQTWHWKRLKLDVTPPKITITSPTNSTVTQPEIQLLGFSPEALSSISYDLTNACGLVSNRDVFISDRNYDTNTFEFTTNILQAYDIDITNGANLITLHVTDLAGNVTTTNFSFTLDYTSKTNPPVISLVWPTNTTEISGDDFDLEGTVNDATVTITGQIVNAAGGTNTLNGGAGRTGTFWVQKIPLSSGTNALQLIFTDAVGNTTATNINVIKSTLVLTMDDVTPASLLWQPKVNLTGTISDATRAVWANGVKGHNNGNGTWYANDVPTTPGGTASFTIIAYEPTEQQPDGTYGNP